MKTHHFELLAWERHTDGREAVSLNAAPTLVERG